MRKRAVVLIGTDKGLCGSLNANLFRIASRFNPETTFYICSRQIGCSVRRAHAPPAGRRSFRHQSPRFAEARPIASFARDMFLKGEVDQVQIVATRFINTMSQEPIAAEFLPVGEIKGLPVPGAQSEAELAGDTTEILFEPSPQAVLSFLFGHYLSIIMYRALLEAKASEQSARMVAMTNATDNATALIRDLTLSTRQTSSGQHHEGTSGNRGRPTRKQLVTK